MNDGVPQVTRAVASGGGGWHFTVARFGETILLVVTARQVAVLVSLAGGEATAVDVGNDWPGLTAGAARARLAALERKGLVHRARHDGSAWTWELTRLGAQALEAVGEPNLDG